VVVQDVASKEVSGSLIWCYEKSDVISWKGRQGQGREGKERRKEGRGSVP
jgi:hypothetical protein